MTVDKADEANLIAQQIVDMPIAEKMREAYLDYSMSVIIGRAIPDVRDGLKPVQRRILYAMHDMGLRHDKAYKKSATVVGEAMGKYHPHGDSAIYDTLVRMAQDFSMRNPLVDGHGNFGSMDGDAPAAMRYTEARLTELAEELLADLKKDTVNWRDNFDGSLQEPEVLPARAPNLLINGSSGIAVGMATNIPPHNLREICDATTALIDDPETTVSELMGHVKGPDFPTGGQICGTAGVLDAYATGSGKITMRAAARVEEEDDERDRIIVEEVPYQVNKARLIKSISDLVQNEVLTGIRDLRDESDRHGTRVVVELDRGVYGEAVLNQLYENTRMETTFGVINLSIVDGEPRVLTLKETLQRFIDHRVEVIQRRTRHDLEKARARAHILEGLRVALDNIDAVVKLIRGSEDTAAARDALMERFDLSEKQAKAILDMRLRRLTSMEMQDVEEEYEGLLADIEEYESILASRELVNDIIRADLRELKEKYGDDRRTDIVAGGERTIKDLVHDEQVVITRRGDDYVKRTRLEEFRLQRRAGTGLIGADADDAGIVETHVSSTLDRLLVFTDGGRVYETDVFRLPDRSRRSKGRPIINALPEMKDEKVATLLPVPEGTEAALLFATRNGKIKKTDLSRYGNILSVGIRAVKLEPGDELIDVKLVRKGQDVVLSTANGMSVRFDQTEAREMGRATTGVIGIDVDSEDEVVSLTVANPDDLVLSVTSGGYGKMTPLENYRRMHRGGKGVISVKTRGGHLVDVSAVDGDEQAMLTTETGQAIRFPLSGVSTMSRNTQGVKLMDTRGDPVIDVSIVRVEDEEEVEEIEGEGEAEAERNEEEDGEGE